MSRCRASCVSSRVLAGRAIDLLVPRLAAMVPLAPNAATASLQAARTSVAPAETPAGPIIGVPHATDYEPARTTAAATIAEEQALMAAASASVPLPRRCPRAKPRQPPKPTLAPIRAAEPRSISFERSPAH
jgi:hypothetical protein